MYRLIIEDDEGRQSVVHVTRSRITIGRREGNTIRLNERNVSRVHARLSESNGAVFLEDAGARYGVKVNGRKAQSRILVREGDDILIGSYHLSVLMQPGPVIVQRAAGLGTLGSDLEETQQDANPELGRLMLSVEGEPPGAEMVLRGAKATVGRTTENDVAVVHPSVHRRHAVFVRDGRRVILVAADGVKALKVNGLGVRQALLQDGNLIEIGSVRFRYVAPAPLAVTAGAGALPLTPMPASAQVGTDPGQDTGGRLKLSILVWAAAGIVALAALLFLLFPEPPPGRRSRPTPSPPAPEPLAARGPVTDAGRDNGDTPSAAVHAGQSDGAPSAPQPADGPSRLAAAPTVADAGPGGAEGVTPSGAGQDGAERMEAARAHVAERRWDDALEQLEQAAATGAEGEELEHLVVQVRSEQHAARQLARATELLNADDPEGAMLAARGVPEGSTYRPDAVALEARVLPRVLTQRNDHARLEYRASRYEEALGEYQASEELGAAALRQISSGASARLPLTRAELRALKRQVRRARRGSRLASKKLARGAHAQRDERGTPAPRGTTQQARDAAARRGGRRGPAETVPGANKPPARRAGTRPGPEQGRAGGDSAPTAARDRRQEAGRLYKQGQRLQMRGRTAEAEALMKKSIELMPGFADPHLGLGLIYARRGEKAKALAAYRKFLIIAPNDRRRGRVTQAMKRLSAGE